MKNKNKKNTEFDWNAMSVEDDAQLSNLVKPVLTNVRVDKPEPSESLELLLP